MTYPITSNIDVLRKIIAYHVLSTTSGEDRDMANKAIDEIDHYISTVNTEIAKLRQFISGEMVLFGSEIDDIQNNR